jgi:hypothetical protein
MPIEVKELHIRVSVNAPADGRPAGVPGPASGEDVAARDALVAECIDQVLQVLRDQKER